MRVGCYNSIFCSLGNILFQSNDYQQLFMQHQLASFEQLWAYKGDWFEEPNQRRGGWSGVARLVLNAPEGNQTAYLKRQQNYTSRTLAHPFAGESTLANEFNMMRRLNKNGVQTANIIFFAQKQTEAGSQAILMTENLEDFVPLELISNDLAALTLKQKRQLLSALAAAIRKMHSAHIQNRSLYAKHLFVKEVKLGYEVAVIDLEKSRLSFLPLVRMISDLVTFNYRTQHWTKSSRLYFFKQYSQQEKLGYLHKMICRYIARQSIKKLSKKIL